MSKDPYVEAWWKALGERYGVHYSDEQVRSMCESELAQTPEIKALARERCGLQEEERDDPD